MLVRATGLKPARYVQAVAERADVYCSTSPRNRSRQMGVTCNVGTNISRACSETEALGRALVHSPSIELGL
jgi:hypothetical protein